MHQCTDSFHFEVQRCWTIIAAPTDSGAMNEYTVQWQHKKKRRTKGPPSELRARGIASPPPLTADVYCICSDPSGRQNLPHLHIPISLAQRANSTGDTLTRWMSFLPLTPENWRSRPPPFRAHTHTHTHKPHICAQTKVICNKSARTHTLCDALLWCPTTAQPTECVYVHIQSRIGKVAIVRIVVRKKYICYTHMHKHPRIANYIILCTII